MCKVMIMKGIQDSKLATDFAKACAIPMTVGNRDGIGYSAVDGNNNLFMQRWHNNEHFMLSEAKGLVTAKDEEELMPLIQQLKPFADKLSSVPTVKVNAETVGTVNLDDVRTITMHTRFATCGKEFMNTHPFVYEGTSLIHNGVISNAYSLGLNKISTCDSENALQAYIQDGIALTTTEAETQAKVQGFLNKLKGYWAFGILAKDSNGQYILDLVRESAQLSWAAIPEIGENCIVFSTAVDTITEACKAVGIPTPKIHTLPECDYYRFNALTGEQIFNFEVQDSVLNKYYGYGNTTTWTPKSSTKTEVKQTKKMNEYTSFHDYNDIEEDLDDRLFTYDFMFESKYLSVYDKLQHGLKIKLQESEELGEIDFYDVLLVLEEYNKTGLALTFWRKLNDIKKLNLKKKEG